MNQQNLRRTPLYDLQESQKAHFVPFADWEMPLSYSGILEEYWAVRRHAGLFDVSHMGRFHFMGKDAAALLDTLLTGDIESLVPGQGCYCILCREDGGILDDVICFHQEKEQFLLIVNGATREKDWNWILSQRKQFPDCRITDLTLQTAMLALQGPEAIALLEKALKTTTIALPKPLERFHLYPVLPESPLALSVSGTGYTGEDGAEIYGSPERICHLWKTLIELGAKPAGLGARDVLRLEMGYLLYGQDATEENHPYEARLGWTVKLSKRRACIGREALQLAREQGARKLLTGLRVEGRQIPRTGFPVRRNGKVIGVITSGGYSPWLKAPIALAYLEKPESAWGLEVEVEIREKAVAARTTRPPFIDRSSPPAD